MLVTGTGPLGCVPAALAQRSTNGECVQEFQQAAAIFNPLLVKMIQELNKEFGSDVFVAANAFQMNMDFISNPKKFGLLPIPIMQFIYLFLLKDSNIGGFVNRLTVF